MAVSPYIANIHIWNMDAKEGRCGHASVELISSEGKSHYTGFWPDPQFTALVNPLTMPIPVPAKSYASLADCTSREAEEGQGHLLPSQTYSIPVTKEQFEEMRGKQAKLDKETAEGKTVYGLIPSISALIPIRWFAASASAVDDVHRCPISGISADHEGALSDIRGIKDLNVENCATAVHTIVGKTLGVGRSITPLGLAASLETHPNVTILHNTRSKRFTS